jgi:hypothetical protein
MKRPDLRDVHGISICVTLPEEAQAHCFALTGLHCTS